MYTAADIGLVRIGIVKWYYLMDISIGKALGAEAHGNYAIKTRKSMISGARSRMSTFSTSADALFNKTIPKVGFPQTYISPANVVRQLWLHLFYNKYTTISSQHKPVIVTPIAPTIALLWGHLLLYTLHTRPSGKVTPYSGYDEGVCLSAACSRIYGPGDGFVYFIRSASGKRRLRGLGLIHMSDAWKEYMLTHYESKRPGRL